MAAAPRDHSHHKPLCQRVMLEALLMTIFFVSAICAIFVLFDSAPAFSDNDSFVTFGIDSTVDPIQKQAERFQFTLYTSDGSEVKLTSSTAYSISAKVESIASYDDSMSETVPYDLLLAWGRMADDDVDSTLTWEQADRRGTVSGKLGGSSGPDVDADYVITHVSNSHVIPATDEIARALDTLSAGDMVRIEGRLVDMQMTNGDEVFSVQTSTSRTDQGDGACEIIYVENIKINENSFN
jgi:hypothetical protein